MPIVSDNGLHHFISLYIHALCLHRFVRVLIRSRVSQVVLLMNSPRALMQC